MTDVIREGDRIEQLTDELMDILAEARTFGAVLRDDLRDFVRRAVEGPAAKMADIERELEAVKAEVVILRPHKVSGPSGCIGAAEIVALLRAQENSSRSSDAY